VTPQDLWNFFKGKIGNLIPNAENAVRQSLIDVPANSAYVQAKIAQAVAPKDILPTSKEISAQANLNKKLAQPLNLLLNSDTENVEKSMAAQLSPYPEVQNTPYNQQLEAAKQTALDTGGYRPAMKRYLSTVPVSGYYNSAQDKQNTLGGTTYSSPTETYRFDPNTSWETKKGGISPFIEMNMPQQINIPNAPEVKTILSHELTHATPRNPALREAYLTFFNSVNPDTQPMLWNIGLKYMNNGQPPPNAEEFYATIAQYQGQKTLDIPEIKKYYENIYQNPEQAVRGGI
jgi:hypothetical protein